MSIDYITCTECGENFADCGEYYVCDNCDRYFCEECGEEYADENGNITEETCPYCKGEKFEDVDVLKYLFKIYNTDYDTIIKEMREEFVRTENR